MTRLRAVTTFLQKASGSWLALGPLALAACLATLLLLAGGRPVRAVPLFQSPPPTPAEQPTETPPPPPPPTETPPPAQPPTEVPPPAEATATPVPPTATPTDTPTLRPRRTRTPADEGEPGQTPQFIVDAAKLIDTLVLYGARVWRCCCGYSALIWVPALLILFYIGGRRQLRPRKRRSRRPAGESRWEYWGDEWEGPSTSRDTYDEER